MTAPKVEIYRQPFTDHWVAQCWEPGCGWQLGADGIEQKRYLLDDALAHRNEHLVGALEELVAEWRQSADEDERYLNRAHASEIHDVYASIRINREHADAVLALLKGSQS
jgi:hypothetical protein